MLQIQDSATPVQAARNASNTASFLTLPQHIRCEIYRLSADADGAEALENDPSEPEARDFYVVGLGLRKTTPYLYCADVYKTQHFAIIESYKKLRMVNKSIREEIIPFLCSRYRVLLAGATLQEPALLSFSEPVSTLLSQSRQIEFRLDVRSYIAWRYYSSYDDPHERVRDFIRIVDHLSTLPHISETKIWLLCEISDGETALSAITPLIRLRLRECFVRLKCMRGSKINAIARQGVELVMAHKVREGHFRFLDLPSELRLHILSFTTLVTPYREMLWSPRSGFRPSENKLSSCPSEQFCSRYGAVFPPCACRFLSPQPFFLVCRSMKDDARQIMYSSNRFIIDSENLNDTDQSPFDPRFWPLEAAVFFKAVPSSSLRWLRELELVFSYQGYNFSGIEPEVLEHWERTIKSAAPFLRNISMAVYLGQSSCCGWPGSGEDHPSTQSALFKAHAQLLQPLKYLGGLSKLFVFATSPFFVSDDEREAIEAIYEQHSRNLEVLVMGPGYDALIHGKMNHHKSIRQYTEEVVHRRHLDY